MQSDAGSHTKKKKIINAEGRLDGMSIAMVRHSVSGRGSDDTADYVASQLAEAGADAVIYHMQNAFKSMVATPRARYRALHSRTWPPYCLELMGMHLKRVDCVMSDFSPLLWCLGLRNRLRLVYLALGDEAEFYRDNIRRSIIRHLLNRCLGRWRVPVLCTGDALARRLRREYDADVILLREGNWFRKRAFLALPVSTKSILRTRRFVVLAIVGQNHAKGPDICLEVLRRLAIHMPGCVEVWLAGTDLGWHVDGLFIRHWGRLEPVRLACLYSNADLLLFTSRSENSPGPPFEAMARGCPVVSSYAGDYLRPGFNCLYVNPSEPVRIAEAVRRLLLCSELRIRLMRGGQTTIEAMSQSHDGRASLVEDFLECMGKLPVAFAIRPRQKDPIATNR